MACIYAEGKNSLERKNWFLKTPEEAQVDKWSLVLARA